jgi:hypothetical protein
MEISLSTFFCYNWEKGGNYAGDNLNKFLQWGKLRVSVSLSFLHDKVCVIVSKLKEALFS